MKNRYSGVRLEYHVIQSFPVTCLNRDDAGAPKTATVGGVLRARVSSQCWKRAVRLQLHENGCVMGIRTKRVGDKVKEACAALGATPEQAQVVKEAVLAALLSPKGGAAAAAGKKKPAAEATTAASSGDLDFGAAGGAQAVTEATEAESAAEEEEDKTETLLFITAEEIERIASGLAAVGFDPKKAELQCERAQNAPARARLSKRLAELAGFDGKQAAHVNALDVALFGRMVAQATVMSVEAAASFAHAISTHRADNEVEFFTALDDYPEDPSSPESAHMGTLSYNSATYYRYVSLDLGQLAETLGEEAVEKAALEFTKALLVAVPAARQTTMAGATPWDFARVLLRRGQGLQFCFDEPVRARDEKMQYTGFSRPSIERLKEGLDDYRHLYGSLFGEISAYDFDRETGAGADGLLAWVSEQTKAGVAA